jgi:hypothetical protein
MRLRVRRSRSIHGFDGRHGDLLCFLFWQLMVVPECGRHCLLSGSDNLVRQRLPALVQLHLRKSL